MALTDKQKRFCDEYLIDLNAKQAAIRAGYSEKTAKQIGQQNLTKLDLKEYITKRMEEKDKSLIAEQDEVMKYLTSVMRREKKESVVVTLNKEQSVYVPDDNGTPRKQTIKEEIPKIIEIPARLSDSNKAAELLGKRYSLFTDNVNLSGDMDLKVVVDYGDEGD
ncbi:MAG: terminase small subunit [Anaerostipes sp.]|nr:terminase small subunit [Anaerostipes sp.]MDD4372233.1 terminase small subunit [Anaerostipes sp.]